MPAGSPRPLVLVPTYNERDNVAPITAAILSAAPAAHVLVIDDGSPDGTGRIADELAAEDPRVFVLHRTKKEGLGRAYLAGFAWALRAPADYTHIITMDADRNAIKPAVVLKLHDAAFIYQERIQPKSAGTAPNVTPAATPPAPSATPH